MGDTKTSTIPGRQSDYLFAPAHESELRFEQGAFGERFAQGAALEQGVKLAPGGRQRLRPAGLAKVIVFGKVHHLKPAEYETCAGTFHRLLRKECQILARGIHTAQQCYDEWLHPTEDGFLVYMAGQSTLTWLELVERSPRPDPEIYGQLAERSRELGRALAANELAYEHVYEMGWKLHQLRTDFGRLEEKVALFRERAIGEAQDITKGLEIVESGAFQVLNLVPTITLMDPFREAAYKIGVVVLRASGRGIGAWTSRSNITRELLGVLKADVPPLVSNLVGGWVSKAMGAAGRSRFGTETVTYLVEQVIELIGDLIVAWSDDRKLTKDELKQIGMNRLTATIAKLLAIAFGGKPGSPRWKQAAGAIAEAAINTLWRDYLHARDVAAADPDLDTLDVLIEELPFTLLRFLQAIVTGVASRRAGTLAAAGRRAGYKSNDGHELLRSQKASAIFALSDFAVSSPAAPRRPLPALELDEYRRMARDMNLHPETAARLRRYAHDEQEAVFFRLPSEHSLAHQGEVAKWPKPVWMKAKTAKQGPHAGLVVTPASGRFGREATHDDYRAAGATWAEGYQTMIAKGAMITPDGVVFHPRQLDALPPGPEVARLQPVLAAARQAGIADFYSADGKRWLMQQYPQEHAAIEKAMNGLRVGFYPDIDVDEVVDLETGQRRVLGDGAKKKTDEEIDYEQRNRDHLDARININHDLEVLGEEAHGSSERLLQLSQGVSPHPKRQSLVQHGGDSEFVGSPAGGPLVVVLSDGDYRIIDSELPKPTPDMPPQRREELERARNEQIQQKKERLLETLLGDDYHAQPQRGTIARLAWTEDPVPGSFADGPGPRPRSEIFYRVKPDFGKRVVVEAPEIERGAECPEKHLLASLLHRGLSQAPERIEAAMGAEGREWVEQAAVQHGVVAAFDAEGAHVVLATRTPTTLGDAVARLARATALLGIADTHVTLWPEIYTDYRPVTSGGVMGRLGGAAPDVKPDPALAAAAPLFDEPRDRSLVCFLAGGFVPTWSPPFEGYPRVGGLELMALYEDPGSRACLEPEGVTLEDRAIVLFPAAPITCPASIDLQLLLDGTAPFPAEGRPADERDDPAPPLV